MTDSLFQSPTKTLTLIQKKATASVGSFITIKFNEPVTDLHFTLYDVDQSSGQFQDKINVTAKGVLNETITPTRNKVIRTANNRFNAPSEILGVSSSDVTATSAEGNVKITFGAPVTEVTLAYTNTDGTRNGDGQQGIGIHNLSWRFEQPIVSLPVELVSFKAQSTKDGVQLSWKTASEQDNKGFEVEVSADGKNFKKIAFVESKVGTSSLTQNYSFIDMRAVVGINYYRLKQIDFDGAFEFSKVVAVNNTPMAASSVYPTLASQEITVRIASSDEQVTIAVADMAGKQLLIVQNPPERQVVLPVQHLQNGIYFVTVISGAQKEVFRFVKR
ncbi:T9SS type A sorting domain-containing protein [Pontibacter virosus]|uniref:Putative secreted protein (Por secretion system target) n=1 Tax=Pontibacter virosus TaxID=1765052 RepID=A0A2U1AVC7_9BACT|nr:T9SS type A sorting domain-containing protein [Pontibacter virosus]PVY40395.1 putative secreted protein (Por secretion system target) [Pontibacter virosus]